MHSLHLLFRGLDIKRIRRPYSINRILDVSVRCTKVYCESVLSSSTIRLQDWNGDISDIVDFNINSVEILLQNVGLNTACGLGFRTDCMLLNLTKFISGEMEFAISALSEESYPIIWLCSNCGVVNQRQNTQTEFPFNYTSFVLCLPDISIGLSVFTDILNITITLDGNPQCDFNISRAKLTHINHLLSIRHSPHQFFRSKEFEECVLERQEE